MKEMQLFLSFFKSPPIFPQSSVNTALKTFQSYRELEAHHTERSNLNNCVGRKGLFDKLL